MKPNRRRFLGQIGLASGAGLLASIGAQLAARAAAPAATDRCLIVNVHGNAWWPKLIRPTAMTSATQWDFQAKTLGPLEAYRDRTIHLERLYNPHGVGLHGNYAQVLTVAPGAQRVPEGISIDRKVALDLQAEVPYSSINFGHTYGKASGVSNVSADGKGQPFPAFSQPEDILATYFADSDASAEEIARRLAIKQSLLDAMAHDIGRMQSRLAGEERAVMDQYLTAVRELETQLELATGQCEPPVYEGPRPDKDTTINPDQSKFYYDAAQAALACGLTRVVTIAHEGVGDEPLQPKYRFDPVNSAQSLHNGIMHPMNGLSNENDDGWAARASSVAVVERVYKWRAQQVAELLDGMHSLDTGGSTLGERTLMLWTHSGGGTHHRGSNEIPALLIGNPDGILKSGQYLKFGAKERCIADVFVTVGQAMGLDMQEFGDPNHNRGALSELFA